MAAAGHKLTLLEIFLPNAEYYTRRGKPFSKVVQGDVRRVRDYDLGRFDVAVWWHGPEHVHKEHARAAITALREIADFVVVGCPWGVYPQDEVYGNPNEKHVTHWRKAELESLGLEVFADGVENRAIGQLIGWAGTLR